jgi:transcriptional regulator with XRE-family HTH domain
MIGFDRMKNHPLKIWRLGRPEPLSQAEIGKKIGCSAMAISRIERWQFPKKSYLPKLKRLTGLEPNDFFKPLRNSAQGKVRGD